MPLDSPSPEVYGLDLDAETRCRHWHGPTDIIAIKMKCCGKYYACKDCHEVLADHPVATWPRSEFHTPAILCGHCRTQLAIATYLASDSLCPHCSAHFNPRCANHYHFYFETN
jgi:uncharacterized CHY-type Zn-finger protein